MSLVWLKNQMNKISPLYNLVIISILSDTGEEDTPATSTPKQVEKKISIPSMPGDSRKDFILVTVANYFGVAINEPVITNLFNAPALNGFLDDGNISILAGKINPKSGKRIDFQNKVNK